MRRATFFIVLAIAACNDLRDFRGEWRGSRVGEAAVLRVGIADDATASLTIDTVDSHGMQGVISIDGLVDAVPFTSLEGAEADALSTMSFSGSPMRVYLAFVPASTGDLLVLVALYDSRRIEVRALRGGAAPVYAIFALTES